MIGIHGNVISFVLGPRKIRRSLRILIVRGLVDDPREIAAGPISIGRPFCARVMRRSGPRFSLFSALFRRGGRSLLARCRGRLFDRRTRCRSARRRRLVPLIKLL